MNRHVCLMYVMRIHFKSTSPIIELTMDEVSLET